MSSPEELTDEQLKALYAWIDAIPLSRPKRNIARDFSDGVLFAEVIAAYFPLLVELHNYTPANSMKQKIYNFETLNTRVLRKLNYSIPRPSIDEIVNCRPGSVEIVLNSLQFKMAKYRERKNAHDSPQGPSPNKSHSSGEAGYGNESQSKSTSKAPSSNRGGKGGDRGGYDHASYNGNGKASVMASVDEEILMEKEQQIRELQETVEILELKIAKLEQLVRLKDNKIQKLLQK
jgi:hypothetical protein|mmetsp:Transcript_26390/g.25268  ORF Transcript_26390/g.25268 Transcript_26390/m.25268 type:complete len:233 (+) Transcript_26390:75-773(+)